MKISQPLVSHEVQMVQEHQELSDRIARLQRFIIDPGNIELSEAEQVRLSAQMIHMEGYERMLSQRLAAVFKEKIGNQL